MSKFSNLLRLLILLRSRKRMKTKDLAKALGVSERMIRKYMSDLAEANINVESIPGPNGGFELSGYDYLLNLNVEQEEAIALQYGTKLLKEDNNFRLIDQMESLNDKIKIISGKMQQFDDYSGNIILKAKPDDIAKEDNLELELQAACISKNKLEITYNSVSSGKTTRIIRPYGIITRNNLKYLIAFCENKQKELTFKLVRIDSIRVLDEKFDIPEMFSIKKFVNSHLGLFNDETFKLKLLIRKPFSKSVSECIYADNQNITWNEDGSIIFEGEMTGKPDIIRWIISMRTSVTIIEPENLKEDIKSELKNMLETI